ncbi:MAG TPA: Calx-beta domain-containing protein, partial [Vicinamibacteria bacterium]|nr:Calx-beta domain-containing protein [Vicinamibacteria bacterium]
MTGTDPQTILVPDSPGVVDVNANVTAGTFATGGVNEIELANPSIAIQGSGTANAPYVKFFLNTTGATGVSVAYNLRDLDGSADNAVQAVALHFRVGAAGNFTNVPAAFVADATQQNAATLVTPVCVVLPAAVDNQPLVEVRVMTTNAAGNDENVGVDDIVVSTAPCGGGGVNLTVGDVTQAEGDAGTTAFNFAVTLSGPAPANVTFDAATADGTATTADNDYVALTSPFTILAGQTGTTVTVLVNGDTTTEPNETFFLNLTNVVGATPIDAQGTGTIVNDDILLTPIHGIQGSGSASPIVGTVVTTAGIVTGVRTNGFFIQAPDAAADADPNTSEGVFVFTSSAPPAAAAVGNAVQVTATVAEFVPSQDPLQPPLTELTTPTVAQLSTGNPLPTATPITTTDLPPGGIIEQLERLEGMRVSAPPLTVVAPTLGNVSEANATATSNGVFIGVLPPTGRPFREPGIRANDPPPSGSTVTIPPVPRFDGNPERLRVDSDGLVGGPLIDVATGATVTGLVGPLDYSFRTYTILPDPPPAPAPVATGGNGTTTVTAPTSMEFTVASYNLERFFDTVDDGNNEPVLTATAFANRLNKASIAIRTHLRYPDVLGVIEVENLSTLQAVAAKISADAIAASEPDPEYDAFLVEGNDVGGIDVGFLVKTAPVNGPTPRVAVNAVVQENAGELFVNPDSSTSLLNDRPSLRLDAVVHHPNGATFPVTVIVNHLRSLNGIDSESPGTNGWPTDGARVRAKRQKQAESLANLVQARQVANPAENIVLVGDFNAFEFNDGYVDSMNTITGTPGPANEVVLPSPDLVNPDLVNLLPPAAERYSFSFDGNAQTLDHVLVSSTMLTSTS